MSVLFPLNRYWHEDGADYHIECFMCDGGGPEAGEDLEMHDYHNDNGE